MPGELFLEVEGDDTIEKLYSEAGGHRIQRIPPTERKGRVHTSTVTVAVIENCEQTHGKDSLLASEFRVEWFSGTGSGGQHRNKHQNSCRLIHIPSGNVATAQCRSRTESYRLAKQVLLTQLECNDRMAQKSIVCANRKAQVGSGMRGDKIRTYRFQDDIVKDDRTGKSASTTKVLKGYFDLLWD